MCGSSCPDPPPQIRSASEGPLAKLGLPYADGTGGRGLSPWNLAHSISQRLDVPELGQIISSKHSPNNLGCPVPLTNKRLCGARRLTSPRGSGTPTPPKGPTAGQREPPRPVGADCP
eukprot:365480-Chlamydomonas_euryale.AAC.5